VFESLRLVDLRKTFCIKISTKPIPNSTAESTRKKNVRDIKFILSKRVPKLKTIKYKVIQSNSAVKRRCNAVVTLILILEKRMKNINIKRLVSPKCRILV